jgi:hypothetical protein
LKQTSTLVISVAEIKDIDCWRLTSRNLVTFLNASSYWLITPDTEVEEFKSVSPQEIVVLPESMFTVGFETKLALKISAAGSKRYGWYLQQLIKLQALKDSVDFDRVVIWDADTVPLRNLDFFDEHGNCKYYWSNEYHLPYFLNIDRLLQLDKVAPYSFIAQSFPIIRKQIDAFFVYLENMHSDNWHDAILESIDFSESSGFSEYEVLGTFVSHFEGHDLHLQEGDWSRGEEYSAIPLEFVVESAPVVKLDFTAFESWNKVSDLNVIAPLTTIESKRATFLKRIQVKQIPSLRLHFSKKKKPDELAPVLANIFKSTDELEVIQLGASNSLHNDALAKFLEKPGSYRATLVEPIGYRSDFLESLYAERSNITIKRVAVGPHSEPVSLSHTVPEVIEQINGIERESSWALGQGSINRATVVYRIHQNSCRNEVNGSQILEAISSIKKVDVVMVSTKKLIGNTSKTLLAVNAQGFELRVLEGLDKNTLPRWVVILDGLWAASARHFLTSEGYVELRFGDDWFFELVS